MKKLDRQQIILESEKPISAEILVSLGNFLEQYGVRALIGDTTIADCQKMIRSEGVSKILSLIPLNESYLEKASTQRELNLLEKTLRLHLESFNPSKSLIIVDSYFFPSRLPDRIGYLNRFNNIFNTIIPNISYVNFITSGQYDTSIYQDIYQTLVTLNPNITVNISTSNDYHDRFWIVDEKDGLFIGTSLNGIGNKYALSDFIEPKDVVSILTSLKNNNLI